MAVSGDGRTLWVGSRREGGQGGIDIWCTSRADPQGTWEEPEPVELLNSDQDDLPRPPGQGGAVLPISSNRDGRGLFQTFLARRVGLHQEFAPLDPLDDLRVDDASMEDGFLTDDGLHLFFRRAALGGEGTLYVTWRTTIDEPFRDDPVSLDRVNSGYDDRDPFVSADRTRFFFASDRRNAASLDIYATRIELPTYR